MRRGWLVRVGTNDLEVVEATVSEPVTPETIARDFGGEVTCERSGVNWIAKLTRPDRSGVAFLAGGLTEVSALRALVRALQNAGVRP